MFTTEHIHISLHAVAKRDENVWRYLFLCILAVSVVAADDVLLFGNDESVLLSSFQLIISENPFYIQAIGVNGTIIDRDSIDPSDYDIAVLNLTVENTIPDGTLLEFRATLATPAGITGTTNVLLGSNTTSSHSTLIYYDPTSVSYAGLWTWYGNASGGTYNNTMTFIAKGGLSTIYRNNTYNPNASYFINQTAIIDVNVTSQGLETITELNTTYNISVNNSAANTSGSTTNTVMIFQNPFWTATHSLQLLRGVGSWVSTAISGGPYWYTSNDTRNFTVYGYMNITANLTSPATITLNDYTSTTCTVGDQFSGYAVDGANVTFYHNGTYLGYNITNSTGETLLWFQATTYGTHTVTCNLTDQPAIYYYRGDAPEGNSTYTAISTPPTIQGSVNDNSNTTGPTNESSFVNFTANATDPEGEQWRLIVCSVEGLTSGNCTLPADHLCSGSLVNNGSIASCQHNTSGELLEQYDWWAYACDSTGSCNSMNNDTSPYTVNHAPSANPTISPAAPMFNSTLTCNANSADSDTGNTVSNAYAWYYRNESAGSFSLLSGQTSNQLQSSFFDSNDQIICQIIPTDNHGLPGNASNSSVTAIANGTLFAYSNLADSQVFRTITTTMNASCTLSDGDSESVTLTIQDNRTGSYAQSSTIAAAVYVSTSSFSLGRLVNQTSAIQTLTVYTQTAGNYSFRAVCSASDAAGNPASSTPQTLEVTGDTTPPVISAVQAANIGTTTATIIWTTDDVSDSDVDYGYSTSMGNSTYSPTMTTSHSVMLTNLANGTTFYYNVTSCNADGYCATSGPNSFVTSALDDTGYPNERGYCTAVLIEPGPDYTPGYISDGDVYDFYCEMPHTITKREQFNIELTNKDKQVVKEISAPNAIYGSSVVLYP